MGSQKTSIDLAVSGISMNELERSAFLGFSEEIKQTVDPMTFVPTLYKHGNIDKGIYEVVQHRFQEGESRISIMEDVVLYLPSVTSFTGVVFCLDKCGYHSLSAKMFLRLMQHSDKIYRLHRSEIRDRTKLHRLARNLKRMVHDAQFKNPREALRDLAKRFRTQFEAETDDLKRQHLADSCVAVLGVEIDAHYDSLACKMEITQEDMLEEMRQIIPFTTNPLVSDTVYYSRFANLDAYRGDFCHGSSMLVHARNSAQNIGSCLELINMLYIEVYVKLWEFENEPSRQLLDAIMMWGRIGLESLENESTDTKEMWSRMFILRMVFALLGIGNRANIIYTAKVDNGNVQMAQNLLASIDTQWIGIETRREMFYCVARARLLEQMGQFSDATLYIARARALAEQGQFLEKIPFIDEFKVSLESKIADTECAITKRAYETDERFELSHISRITDGNALQHCVECSRRTPASFQSALDNSELTIANLKVATDDNIPLTNHLRRVKTFGCHPPGMSITEIKGDMHLLKEPAEQDISRSSNCVSVPAFHDLKEIPIGPNHCNDLLEHETVTSREQHERNQAQMLALKSELESSTLGEDSISKLKKPLLSSGNNDDIPYVFQNLAIEEAIFPHDIDASNTNRNQIEEYSQLEDSFTELKLAAGKASFTNVTPKDEMQEAYDMCQPGAEVVDSISSSQCADNSAAKDSQLLSTQFALTDMPSSRHSTVHTHRGFLCNEAIPFPSVVLFESRGEPEGISREEPGLTVSVNGQYAWSARTSGNTTANIKPDCLVQGHSGYVSNDEIDDEDLFGEGKS